MMFDLYMMTASLDRFERQVQAVFDGCLFGKMTHSKMPNREYEEYNRLRLEKYQRADRNERIYNFVLASILVVCVFCLLIK